MPANQSFLNKCVISLCLFAVVVTLAFATNQPLPVRAAEFIQSLPASLKTMVASKAVPATMQAGANCAVPNLGTGQPGGGTLPDYPIAMTAGDLNGDGKADLIFAMSPNNKDKIAVSFANANGTFTAPQLLATNSATPQSYAIADFTGDSKNDIGMVSKDSATTSSIRVYKNNGDGTFTQQSTVTVNIANGNITAGDLNNDGKVDVVVTVPNVSTNNLVIALGKGDGSFDTPVVSSAGASPWLVKLADFNKDGKPDLTFPNTTGGTFRVYLGNGDGTFQTPTITTLTSALAVAPADLNRDGKVDLAVLQSSNPPSITIYLGNGDGTFTKGSNFTTGNSSGATFAAQDINCDDIPDLVMSSNEITKEIFYLTGKGDGTFNVQGTITLGSDFGVVIRSIWTDAVGDKEADLLVGTYSPPTYGTPYKFGVLANLCGGTCRGGSAPTITPVAVSVAKGTTLTAATLATVSDAETPAGNLVVTATTVPAGLSLTNITNTNGTIKANLAADCTLAIGTSTVVLTVADTENKQTTGNLTVNVTAGIPPTQGEYAAATVGTGGATQITPNATPTAGSSLTIYAPSFTGNVSVNSQTGTVSVNNAGPKGTHTVTVFASGGCATSSKTFTLTVNGPATCTSVSFPPPSQIAAPLLNDAKLTFVDQLLVSDFNSDGKPDVVARGREGISVLLGNGAGLNAATLYPFTIPTNLSPGLAVLDRNNDGKPDIAVVTNHATAPTVRVTFLLSNGDGTFTTDSTLSYVGNEELLLPLKAYFNKNGAPVSLPASSNIAVGDFNKDGHLDRAIAFTSSNDSRLMTIELGNGDGTFKAAVTYDKTLASFFNAATNIVPGDFDNDGVIDLALGNTPITSGAQFIVMRGNGDGTFTLTNRWDVLGTRSIIASADFNGDGKQDILATNLSVSATGLTLYLNNCLSGANTPPTITPAAQITMRPGQILTTTIATVDDAETPARNLAVRVTNRPHPLITVENVTNNNGTITAEINVTCPSSPGDYTIPLEVTDGNGSKVTANGSLRVTGNAPPKIGVYQPINLAVGASTTSAPSFAPSDDAAVKSVKVSSFGFQGQLSVNQTTGVVTITDAKPQGNYTVEVIVEDSCGERNTAFFTLNVGVNGPTFAITSNYFGAGSNPSSLAVLDLNGDGKLDLITTNLFTGTITILFGDGSKFTGQLPFTVGGNPLALLGRDFNGDGKPDLGVVLGKFPPTFNRRLEAADENAVAILLNDGSGGLTKAATIPVGSNPNDIASGDFNGDGKADLAVPNIDTNNVSILLGLGNGQFSAAMNFACGNAPAALAVGDFNGDGKTDLAVTNATDNKMAILLGAGDGSFGSPAFFAVGTQPEAIATGDFNADSKLDLVTANYGADNVSVLLGTGQGSFGTANQFPTGSEPTSVKVADMNGDNKLDLVVANEGSNNVSILNGNGTGTFGTPINFPVGSEPSEVAIADFNGDGRFDFLTANSASNNIALLVQQSLDAPGYEGDLASRPNGDGNLSISDWVIAGRFVVKLDSPALGGEFQRADCAPRESKGDGQLTLADYVQAGRYAVGLDAIVATGGPSGPANTLASNANSSNLGPDSRTVRAVNANFTRDQVGVVNIELDSQGGENALAFTLNFDPTQLTFSHAALGTDASGAQFTVNAAQAAQGRLGVMLSLPAGQAFTTGALNLLKLHLIPVGGGAATTTQVSFSDQILKGEIVSQTATTFAKPNFQAATINISGRSATTVSAANYLRAEVALDSIAAIFGTELATGNASATSLPLPTTLGGTTVKIRDSNGTEKFAPLFYVSPEQVNYQLPEGLASGLAIITVTNSNAVITTSLLRIGTVSPGVFSFEQNGRGFAAADFVRVAADNSQRYERVATYNETTHQWTANAIDLAVPNETIYLILYGTGLRQRTSLSNVKVMIGGVEAVVEYAGAQSQYAGLDQINIHVPRSLAGRGEMDVELIVDGILANTVRIATR